jgi:hypothetical protein
VCVDEGAGYLVVWDIVPRNFFLLFLLSGIQGFVFAISNCTDGFMSLSKQEMKPETNFIA